MLSRGDFKAMVAHYRLRGADGVHVFESAVQGYTQTQQEQDAADGFNFQDGATTLSLASIYAGGNAKIATIDTAVKVDGVLKSAETAGVIFSGVYSLTQGTGRLALLVSNLDGITHSLSVPAKIGTKTVPGSFSVQAGQHRLLEFTGSGTQWNLIANTAVFIDNNRDGVGVSRTDNDRRHSCARRVRLKPSSPTDRLTVCHRYFKTKRQFPSPGTAVFVCRFIDTIPPNFYISTHATNGQVPYPASTFPSHLLPNRFKKLSIATTPKHLSSRQPICAFILSRPSKTGQAITSPTALKFSSNCKTASATQPNAPEQPCSNSMNTSANTPIIAATVSQPGAARFSRSKNNACTGTASAAPTASSWPFQTSAPQKATSSRPGSNRAAIA